VTTPPARVVDDRSRPSAGVGTGTWNHSITSLRLVEVQPSIMQCEAKCSATAHG
jgi:hypothetical protein